MTLNNTRGVDCFPPAPKANWHNLRQQNQAGPDLCLPCFPSLLPVLGGIKAFLIFEYAAVVIQIFNRCSFITFQLKYWSAVNLSWLGTKRYKPAALIQLVSWDHYCWKLGLQSMCIIVCLPAASQCALHAHPKRPDNSFLNLLERNLLRYMFSHTALGICSHNY